MKNSQSITSLKTIQFLIELQLKKNGIKMSKKISSGGLFGGSVYDERTVHSFEELFALNREGFLADENLGTFLFNAFVKGVGK